MKHPSAESLEVKWQTEYRKLESEIELFRIHFLMTKKCKCDWKDSYCTHFRKERDRLFGKRIDSLFKVANWLGAVSQSRVFRV